MNQHLKTIQDLLQQNKNLSDADKEALLKSIIDADKQWSITDFKLDRTEKVKKTTAILLEETIEELEQKRKAVEAQNRELEIESSLEKVRTVAMGMRNRDDMLDICRIMSGQLESLGFKEIRNVQTAIFYKDKGTYINYEYYRLHDKTLITEVDYTSDKISIEFAAQMTKGAEEIFIRSLAGKEVKDWYHFQKTTNVFIDTYLEKAESLTYYWFSLGPVALGLSSYLPLSEQDLNLFKRFRNVFGLAYQRYLDIEQAEAQAREAQIQLALERVRARTMAMQKSDELAEAASLLFQQVRSLGIETFSSGYTVWSNDDKDLVSWMCNADGSINPPFVMPISADIRHVHMYESWKAGKALHIEDMSGETMQEYYRYLRSYPLLDEAFEKSLAAGYTIPGRQVHNIANFSHGNLLFITYEHFPETHDIFKRFAKVFEQTYTRFLDLQKAEAQTRESQIEAALERVRSRTLAMQKSDELAETAAVLFQQLIALGIEPNRLYIAIVKDENGEAEFWITDEDGSKVSTAYAANLNDNPAFSKMYEGWKQQKKSLVIDMQGEELSIYFRHLTSIGVPFKSGLTQKRRVQDIAYFSKGFIGMASPDEQPAETLQLLERFAYVFNLTFTRFSDLQIAEAHALQAEKDLIAIKEAKQKAEEALTELQATQKQLIQSEKMASLGELTAGIAHEIQNPLNFVNNFSEVSRELLDEMKTELDNGNTADAKDIATDVMQNLEKILHHGKRADGIVKGMLQHSRASSGQKELTDINMLADEYLRLAYHGLRAKDKSFNATLNHDFDRSIEKINLIPQDIGRVFVNLINNAFYAVNEKTKQQIPGYEPTVTIITKKMGDKAELRVMDNGNGIPKKVLDKIFQPFFTTKPTGQGTGLGLSLAYDIITKGHGGELKVKTKEGEGSTFIIQLQV